MDALSQPINYWSSFVSIVNNNIEKLSFARETFDSIRGRMNSILDDPAKLAEFFIVQSKPKEFERQQNGEVFTPPSVINEKLDKLQEYCPDIWSNPNRTFLDPANGIGNYPALAYQRLMKGLEDVFPNEAQRKRHILENMIYMCEKDLKNVEVSIKLLNPYNQYDLKLFKGSFFDLNTLEEWGIAKFDVIFGNPPYNIGGIRSSTGKKLTKDTKTETIWPKFVDKSIKLLKQSGYLVFVHPLSWLKTSHSVHDILLDKHILWMMLWDDSMSKSTISADIPLSIYIMHNVVKNQGNTVVESKMLRQKSEVASSVFLNKCYTIPLAYHSIFEKIICKMEEHPELKLDVKSNTVKADGSAFKLPDHYTADDMIGIDTYRIKDGYFVKKMKSPHPDINTPKLIIANKRGFNGCFVDNGKLGLVGNHKFYLKGEQLDILCSFLNTPLCTMIANNTKYGQSFLDKDTFQYIMDVRNIPKSEVPVITNESVYRYLDLTDDEIAMIESC
jgi:hypothetical protein